MGGAIVPQVSPGCQCAARNAGFTNKEEPQEDDFSAALKFSES
jgi:hypothetical protein